MVGIQETSRSFLKPGKCFCGDCKSYRFCCCIVIDGQTRKEGPPHFQLLWHGHINGSASSYCKFVYVKSKRFFFIPYWNAAWCSLFGWESTCVSIFSGIWSKN